MNTGGLSELKTDLSKTSTGVGIIYDCTEDDLSALMNMHCHQEIPDPADTIPDLPEALRHFIMRCCAIDPGKRYGSAGEALLAVEKLAPQLPIQPEKDKRMLTSILMVYPEKDRKALQRLLENFSREVEGLGIVLKISETTDI